MIADLDYEALKTQLSGLTHRQQAAFAAFWAQRLSLFYDRSARRSAGDPPFVQRCLDLAWSFAAGARLDPVHVSEAQHQLEHLAPNAQKPPALGYAAMKSVAAAWDALASVQEATPEHAADACAAQHQAVTHFLLARDRYADWTPSADHDARGLISDPIWQPEEAAFAAAMQLLASLPEPSADLVRHLKARATDESARALADLVTAFADPNL